MQIIFYDVLVFVSYPVICAGFLLLFSYRWITLSETEELYKWQFLTSSEQPITCHKPATLQLVQGTFFNKKSIQVYKNSLVMIRKFMIF